MPKITMSKPMMKIEINEMIPSHLITAIGPEEMVFSK
jgi:hypothetical protein